MLYQQVFYIILLLFFVKSAAESDEDLTDLSNPLLYNGTKQLPFIGCTIFCSVDANDTKFYWNSKDDTQSGTIIDIFNPTIISKSKITVFIIFGWFNDYDDEWVQNMTQTFTTLYNYDVVIVDWSKFTKTEYVTSSNAVKCIGNTLGEIFANLHQSYTVPLPNIKIVGFSLGAHLAGYAGKTFTALTGQKLPLIIGLDPAGPCFNPNSEDHRLCPTDADVVHAIHCSAFTTAINFVCGTLDTWLNSGCFQPGCVDTYFTQPFDVTGNVACSHSRCPEVFTQAILHSQKLIAQECGPWIGCDSAEIISDKKIDIGEMEAFQTGQFCINTTDTAPFYNN